MLIAILLMMIVTIITIAIFSKSVTALLQILFYSCFILLLGTFFVYVLKVRGVPNAQMRILFGGHFLFSYLTNIPIGFNLLGSMMIFGRMGFCLFFFANALRYNHYSRIYLEAHPIIAFLTTIPLIGLTFVVLPSVFTPLFAYKYTLQRFVIATVNLSLYVYLATSLGLLIFEYFSAHISFLKRQRGTLTVAMVSVALQYLFFASFEPITIYQNYGSIRVGHPLLFSLKIHSIPYWTTVLSLCVFSTMLTLFSTWKYYKYDYNQEKMELVIKEKIDTAGISASVLIHGLKNQLLAFEILTNKLNGEIANIEENDTRNRLMIIGNKLVETNTFLKERLNILYRSFIDVRTKLVPIESERFLALLQEKMQNHPKASIVEYSFQQGTIMADNQLLSEAIYNLITNALEATEKDETPSVLVTLQFLRARALIQVQDNGLGIPKSTGSKIFMPFNTTKNSQTNWGLGLCYTRMIIKKHLGDIRYDSKIGEGTVFYVSLPIYRRKQ